MAVLMAALVAMLYYGDYEVESSVNGDSDHPGIVYIVDTSPGYLQRLRVLFNNKPIRFVCPNGTETEVARHYPEAVFELPPRDGMQVMFSLSDAFFTRSS